MRKRLIFNALVSAVVAGALLFYTHDAQADGPASQDIAACATVHPRERRLPAGIGKLPPEEAGRMPALPGRQLQRSDTQADGKGPASLKPRLEALDPGSNACSVPRIRNTQEAGRLASPTCLRKHGAELLARRSETDSEISWPDLSEDSNFLVKPYIQLGDKPVLTASESLTLLWETPDREAIWSVQLRRKEDVRWRDADKPRFQTITLPPHKPRRFFTERLTDLPAGQTFEYRLLKNNIPVWKANAEARKGPTQPYRFAVFGDCGHGTRAQRQIAYQTYMSRPDFVLVPGDIVYTNGTLSEYMLNFFPAYNADKATKEGGAPLLRSTLFVAAPGNHDIDLTRNALSRNLSMFPDGLAYFFLWSQPLNGPSLSVGQANTPRLIGSEAHQQRFLAAAGDRYPRMTNFSFDYGNAHYLVLDGNIYMDWTDEPMRAWVEEDLKAARQATWRFVCFHQPGFNSDWGHITDQRMRLLSDIFERQQVDIVFAGHSHNYQRTYPLRFTAQKQPDGNPISSTGEVAGTWSLDKSFNGENVTQPDGILYIVSGAGGAPTSGSAQAADPSTWQEFTYKFIAQPHSFTVCDVKDKTLSVRQIARTGEELDRFTLTKWK